MQKGAKDVSLYHGITKKGRPTNLISVICDDKSMNDLLDTLISETGTLGIRVSTSERFTLPRTVKEISIDLYGSDFVIHYKVYSFKGKFDFKIEFDDLKHISNVLNKPIKQIESLIRNEIEKHEG